MKDYQKQIHQWMEDNRRQATDLLKQMIQAKSLQGEEKNAQFIVRSILEEVGLEIDMWELDEKELKSHPSFSSSRASFADSYNLVGRLKGSGGGKSIILNGHIDVVPEGDRNTWDYPPYGGEEVDGRVYGRGASDMKGGNLSLILAIQVLKELDVQLKGDIIFQSVIEEESGGAGTLATLMRGYKADAAIIPEPTNMKIFPKQQGSIWFRVFVNGLSAHGGTRYKGVSAIDKAIEVIKHIKKLEDNRNKKITDPLYKDIPIPIPINIGVIEGGNWPSSVPDQVKIEGRIGVSPGETIEQVQREMEEWLAEISKTDEWFIEHPLSVEWFGARWLPGEIDVNHQLMNIIKAKYERVENSHPIIEASPWGTDGGLLSQLGDIPTIVFGPGITNLAHFKDEYIEIDKVLEVAEIIALTLIEWCEAV